MILTLAINASALEVKYPVLCYEGAELKKVKEWEKTWAGKRIATANADEVKEFLPETLFDLIKNPETQGAKELWFQIVPYRPFTPSKGFIEATKKYAYTKTITPDGGLTEYAENSGLPFPEPKSGIEMAYNLDFYTRGDTRKYEVVGQVIDVRSKIERFALQEGWEMFWTGRTDVPPVPKITPNRKDIRTSSFHHIFEPPEFFDLRLLEIKYNDQDKEKDMWQWVPTFRRITRYSAAQKTDNVGATDMIYDDKFGWYSPVKHNEYSFLYRKEILAARHTVENKEDFLKRGHVKKAYSGFERAKGQGFYSGVKRERINAYVVEVISKDPHYIYSKQVWYMDPESWWILYKSMYDKKGRLWKIADYWYDVFKGNQGEPVMCHLGENFVDIQRKHSSSSPWQVKEIGKPYSTKMFSLKALEKAAF
jgi:hypothetical protein